MSSMVYFWLFVQQCISSSALFISKEAVRVLDPLAVLPLRVLLATIAWYVLIVIRQRKLNIFYGMNRREIRNIIFLGALNVPINQYLYLEGLQYTTAANGALLFSLTPAIVFLLALRTHLEQRSWKKIVGILIAFFGAAILLLGHGTIASAQYTLGNTLIFGAVVAWALFTILAKPLIMKYGAVKTMAQQAIVGAICYLPFAVYTFDRRVLTTIAVPTWVDIVYLALISSVCNFYIWANSLRKLEVSKVSIFQNVQPVLTVTVAILLGEAIITGELIGGTICAIVGVVLIQRG